MAVTLRHLVAVLVFIGLSTAAPGKRLGGKTVFCYYGSWASYRQNEGKLDPDMIDTDSCTHIVYTFAGLDERNFHIKALDAWNDLGNDEVGGGKDGYRKFTNLQYKGVTVLLGIGGWNEGSVKYSTMVSQPARRKSFIDSAVTFLHRYGFQGLDFDWEWPGGRGGKPSDKANLVLLLKEMRTEFNKTGLLLTAAAPALPNAVNTGYDLVKIMPHVDYLSVMTYDYHTDYNRLDHGTPLHPKRPGQLAVAESIDYYLLNGGIPEKLLLGVSLYGRTFVMADSDKSNINDPARGPGEAGPHSQTRGLLTWFELCGYLNDGGFTVVRDATYQVPYAYNGIEWFAYEDEQSLKAKVEFAQSHNLGGIMVWSLENDDNHLVCGPSLTSSIKAALK